MDKAAIPEGMEAVALECMRNPEGASLTLAPFFMLRIYSQHNAISCGESPRTGEPGGDSMFQQVSRREFVRSAAAAGAAVGLSGRAAFPDRRTPATPRVIGANDQINLGIIGVGGRGASVGRAFAAVGNEKGMKEPSSWWITACSRVAPTTSPSGRNRG